MSKKIYLVRHGKIAWEKEKSYIGQMDLALDPEGEAQSRRLNDYFRKIPLDKAYFSPLIRCKTTLDGLLADRNVPRRAVNELMEISMGDWDGQSFSEIRSRYPRAYEKRGQQMDRFAPPGGECFMQLQQRVMPAFKKIVKEPESNQLLVVHAGVIRVILSSIMGMPLKELFKWPIAYGGVYELNYVANGEKWMCTHRS